MNLATNINHSKINNEENSAMGTYSMNSSNDMVQYIIEIDINNDDSHGYSGTTINHHDENNNSNLTRFVFK